MFDSTFNHNKFRMLIDKSGLSNAELSKKIGIDASLINRHYNGDKNRPISVYYLEKYCKYFDVTPNYFYDLENEKLLERELLSVVCEYTGLNQNSIDLLHDLTKVRNAIKSYNDWDDLQWDDICKEIGLSKPPVLFEYIDYETTPPTLFYTPNKISVELEMDLFFDGINILLEKENCKTVREIGGLSNTIITNDDKTERLNAGLYKLNIELANMIKRYSDENTEAFWNDIEQDQTQMIDELKNEK